MKGSHPMKSNARLLLDVFESKSCDLFELCDVADVEPSYSLFNADFSGIDLSGKNLNGFDLSRANLVGATLLQTQMFFTNLQFSSVRFEELKKDALFANSAILPAELLNNLSSDKEFIANQQCARHLLNAYDDLNEKSNEYNIDGDENDARYNLAVLLDTIGSPLDEGLYILSEYALCQPLKWDEPSDQDIIEKIRLSSAIPREVSNGLQWILNNKLSREQAYSLEDIDLSFLDLPSFFWREKLYYWRNYIDRLICQDEFDDAERHAGRCAAYCVDRSLEWRWAQFRIQMVVVTMSKNEGVDGFQLTNSIIATLPRHKRNAAGADAVWLFYLGSMQVSSSELRDRCRAVASKLALQYWGDKGPNKAAIEVLSNLSSFWEIMPNK